MKKRWVMAGIDVGTTKICSAVAEVEGGSIQVLGTGLSPSRGLKKGIVVNLSETVESIKVSLEEAEAQAQTEVSAAYVSVGGGYLRSINSSGETEVRGRGGEVGVEDIERAIEAAKNFEIPSDYEIIHVLTRSFSLDGHPGVVNPLGMNGKRLEVHLHVVLNASAIVQNIVNSVNKAGLLVSGVVMQQLASAEAVLETDEKEMGSIVVDIGGGTTDIAIYLYGSLQYSEVLSVGGNLITKDLAIGLKTPLHEAEQLKREVSTVYPDRVPAEEMVEISEVGTGNRRTVQRRLLCQIVQARCDEILNSVARVIHKAHLPLHLMSGVVLTGGASLLDGLIDRAEEVLQMPVRIGFPKNVVSRDDKAFHPAYATALGLLGYAHKIPSQTALGVSRTPSNQPLGMRQRMKSWLMEKIS